MSTDLSNAAVVRKIRIVLGIFMVALALSGLTAFPLERELTTVCSVRGLKQLHPPDVHDGLGSWLLTVCDGLGETYAKYPWVLQAGLIACVLVLPLALICGAIRQIPLGWRLIDCSFGVFGAVPLWFCVRWTRQLEASGDSENYSR